MIERYMSCTLIGPTRSSVKPLPTWPDTVFSVFFWVGWGSLWLLALRLLG